MFERNYQLIIGKFLSRQTSVDEFINEFMLRWKADRGVTIQDEKFRRLIDRLFTSCDCYGPAPSGPIEISERELRNEVELLSHVWWNLSSLDGSIKTID